MENSAWLMQGTLGLESRGSGICPSYTITNLHDFAQVWFQFEL